MKHAPLLALVAFASVFAPPTDIRAQQASLELTTVTVPANLIACVQFVLVDDDDDTARAAVEAARRAWGGAVLASGISKAGSLFVLDTDRARIQDQYPIALSICATIEARPTVPTSLSFVDMPEKSGQIAFCALPDVEACIQQVRHMLQASPAVLPEFPRYGLWTSALPPANADEAVAGLIGAMIPVQARVAQGSSPVDVPAQSRELRPLGGVEFASCSSAPAGCPTVEGPGTPTGVLVFIADP